ncbi:MAG: hypothetical protein ACXAAO_11800 [Candidatus Thorarchaeota archaeon]|jgi:hypothetical protein
MSSNDPLELIDQYLDRVRVYLPLDSEDALVELQTHIRMEAERIGEGNMTAGSVMMAIERMGDPKSVAHEYAGSGEKVGPVPAEYVSPVSRTLVVLAGVALAIITGASMIGVTFTQLIGADIQNWPFSIPVMILINLAIVLVIIGGISMLDRSKPLTDKTTLESIFGIGVEGFKPKGKLDAIGDLVFGVIFAFILMLPAVVILYSAAFTAVALYLVVFLLLGAIRGALFYIGGENNLNLAVEGILSVVWIGIAVVLLNVGWPFERVYYMDGTWRLFDLVGFFETHNIPFINFDWIWAFIMFVTVAIAIWRVLVSTMKITMYVRAGRGVWWQGNWGESRRLRRGFWKRRTQVWKRVSDNQDSTQNQSTRNDGYIEPDESQ